MTVDSGKVLDFRILPGVYREDDLCFNDVLDVIKWDRDNLQQLHQLPQLSSFFPTTSNVRPGTSRISPQPPVQPQPQAQQPFIRIVEQPAARELRFRYGSEIMPTAKQRDRNKCEGRSAGSLPGANSTSEVKTYPTIEVVGYKGKAVVVVSCVTRDPPYRAHPHNLVGKEGCKEGVCRLRIPEDTMRVQFTNLGIKCVRRRDIKDTLQFREKINQDPYKQGFGHIDGPWTPRDLYTVRLCFQVFLESWRGKLNYSLDPVVSDPIFDKKMAGELKIIKLSDCVSDVDGGKKDIILLCKKVTQDDIKVRFFEEKNGQVVWQATIDVQPEQVYKQYAIWFRTPQYRTLEVTEPVQVFIQLYRQFDDAISEPVPFQLMPMNSGVKSKRKMAKIHDPHRIIKQLTEYRNLPSTSGYGHGSNPLNIMDPTKIRPEDRTSPYGPSGHSLNHKPNMYLSPQCYPDMASPDSAQYRYSPNSHFQQPTGDIQQAMSNVHVQQPTGSFLQPIGNVRRPADNKSWNIAPFTIDLEPAAALLDTYHQVNLDGIGQTKGALPDMTNLSLSDMEPQIIANMSDSLTTLENNAIDQMCEDQNQF